MDFQNQTIRFVDVGLDLRDTVDKVAEGKWSRLTNIRANREGSISTREGRSLVNTYPLSIVHSIKRLGVNDLVVGAGNSLFRGANLYNDLYIPTTFFSGFPLSLVTFRPEVSPTAWIYVADSAKMRKVNADGVIWKWGITKPTGVVAAINSGSGNLDSTVAGATTYEWRATYYNAVTGSESNPTDVSSATLGGSGFKAKLSVAASNDFQVTQVRFYRRGGVQTQTWRLAVTAPNPNGGTVEVEDNQTDAANSLSKAISLDNDVPFTSVSANGSQVFGVAMPYAAGPFLGKYIFACGDPNRKGYLYWTNANNPDGASSSNNVQISDPEEALLAVFLYDGRPFVFTQNNLYEIQFGQGAATFEGRLTGCGRGIAAPWAYCVGPEIYFVSKDGIYATTGDRPATNITDESLRPLFQGQSAGGLDPIDWRPLPDFSSLTFMRLFFAGQELHFTYMDINGRLNHLMWNAQYQRWKHFEQTGKQVTVGYAAENVPEARVYLGTLDGDLYYTATATSLDNTNVIPTTDNGGIIQSHIRTGSMDLGMPQTLKDFAGLIIDADAQLTTIRPRVYLNGETFSFILAPIVGIGEGRRKYAFSLAQDQLLGTETFGYSIAVDLEWEGQATVYQMEVLWRPDEEEIVHWEFPATSHQLTGWQQLRDIYLTTRSQVPLLLTIQADDQADTYVVPATGGLKKKQCIKLNARKGKLFRYRLDTTVDGQPFRVYGEDCEARLKVWNTNLGYDLVSVFRKA